MLPRLPWPIPQFIPITNKTTESPPINIDPCGEKILTTKWLEPEESIASTESIIERIKKIRTDLSRGKERGVVGPLSGLEVSADQVKQTKLTFLDLLLLLLSSHAAVVRHLNSRQAKADIMKKLIGAENITCDIPWDEELDIPSCPVLAADARSYPKIFKPEDKRIGALCESFSGWSLYSTQKELCACNSRLKVNELMIEIMVNHILKTEDDKIFIKQLIGLRSEDPKRLEKHYYEDKVPSRFVDSLLIINDVSATFSLEKGLMALVWTTNPPEQFKIDKFQKQVSEIVGAFLNENPGKEGTRE